MKEKKLKKKRVILIWAVKPIRPLAVIKSFNTYEKKKKTEINVE